MVFTDALQTIIMLVGAIFLAAVGEAIVGSNTAGNIGTRHAHEHDVLLLLVDIGWLLVFLFLLYVLLLGLMVDLFFICCCCLFAYCF